MAGFMDRLKTSYNVLANKVNWVEVPDGELISSSSPSSISNRVTYDNTKTVLAPIMTRIAIDVSAIPLRHVIVDEYGQFLETKHSELNDRLTIRANLDQSGAAFIQDAVMTMLSDGVCALVPVEITSNPNTGSYEITSLRVGRVNQWFNGAVEVSVYNELTGDRVEKILPKGYVAIAYNPLYPVMNEPNSTLRRLIDRLALLDQADGRQFSPQLDLIIQVPYTLKNERRQAEAERRLAVIEEQLHDSKYGIAYMDANEKITQLNRPVTNTLFETVTSLTESLHSQLGLTPAIFSGTASEEEILLYNNRTLLPIIKALTDAMVGSFFTRTAIRQGHTILPFPSLFKMAPLADFAEAADKLTRNEILSSNEVRAALGIHPAKDPEADELRNKNLNKQEEPVEVKEEVVVKKEDPEVKDE